MQKINNIITNDSITQYDINILINLLNDKTTELKRLHSLLYAIQISEDSNQMTDLAYIGMTTLEKILED